MTSSTPRRVQSERRKELAMARLLRAQGGGAPTAPQPLRVLPPVATAEEHARGLHVAAAGRLAGHIVQQVCAAAVLQAVAAARERERQEASVRARDEAATTEAAATEAARSAAEAAAREREREREKAAAAVAAATAEQVRQQQEKAQARAAAEAAEAGLVSLVQTVVEQEVQTALEHALDDRARARTAARAEEVKTAARATCHVISSAHFVNELAASSKAERVKQSEAAAAAAEKARTTVGRLAIRVLAGKDLRNMDGRGGAHPGQPPSEPSRHTTKRMPGAASLLL